MSRLNLLPIIRGHWNGLSDRSYAGDGKLREITPDRPARAASIGIPAIVAVGVMFAPANGIDRGVAVGVALAWSALASAGLLGAFTLLAGWRSRLSDRQDSAPYLEMSQRPLLALVDEAVAHGLAGVLDSLTVAAFAAASAIFASATRPLLAVSAAFAAHAGFVFVLMATRLYSAYTQVENVAPEVNGSTSSTLAVRPSRQH